jgi:spermidine synthase
MTEEVLQVRTRQIVEQDTLRVRHEDNGRFTILSGLRELASDHDAWLADQAIRCLQITKPQNARIAHIGGGLCILPRLLRRRGYVQHIYELEPKVIEWATAKFAPESATWTFVQGDYLTTLTGNYDVIAYDLSQPANVPFLQSHLSAGGLLIGAE